jgi:hypothetical protein
VFEASSLINTIGRDAAEILATAVEDDIIALFSSFSASVGSTGVAVTAANMTDAISGIRNRGNRAPGGLVGCVSDVQMADLEDVFETVTTSWLSYPHGADRLLNLQPGPNNGMVDAHVLSYKGVPFFQSGLVDTANTAADDVGAVFIRGDVEANRPHCAIGMAVFRPVRIATQRDESLRATEIVVTRRCGVGILVNSAGTKIVTDA